MSKPTKRVAVIGLGPAGAITVDALARETAFRVIRVFERHDAPGGCWYDDGGKPAPRLTNLEALAARTADVPLSIPASLPARTPKSLQPRFDEGSIYPYLETNVHYLPMQFSQEPIPAETSERGVALNGKDTPFRSWRVVLRYIQALVDRRGYSNLVSYNTTVERAIKVNGEWRLALRKSGAQDEDEWWEERFDAVVAASGHYNVPYIPPIGGLQEFENHWPGSLLHSKHFRGREVYRNKHVVVVGASVSAADIAVDLVDVAQTPVHAVVVGHTANEYFGASAFDHPRIMKVPSIERVEASTRSVHFVDGTSVADIDNIIFGTGFTWSIPFLPQISVRNNRIPGLYQHVIYQEDPSLCFVGAVGAGLTFRIFEWQAVLAAAALAGRVALPSLEKMRKWEQDRIHTRGDGPKFTIVNPDFASYLDDIRTLTHSSETIGRPLPPFETEWLDRFMAGHDLRIAMWKRLNNQATL